LVFSVFGYVIGLGPYLFLPEHKSAHYLLPVLPFFWLLVFYPLSKFMQTIRERLVIVVFCLSLFLLFIVSINLQNITYWAAERGRIAQKLIVELKAKYPMLEKGSVIYFLNDSSYPFISDEWGGTAKQAYFALNGNDGVRLVYQDNSLKSFYQGVNDQKIKLTKHLPFVVTLK